MFIKIIGVTLVQNARFMKFPLVGQIFIDTFYFDRTGNKSTHPELDLTKFVFYTYLIKLISQESQNWFQKVSSCHKIPKLLLELTRNSGSLTSPVDMKYICNVKRR